MKNFSKNLQKAGDRIINQKTGKMKPLKMRRINYISKKKFVIYAKKNLVLMMTIKNTIKFGSLPLQW